MNTAILSEANFLISSFLWGVFLFFIYDCLLVFRNIVKHNRFFIAMEDIVYWVIAGILIFRMMYNLNHGTVRWYSVVGIAFGMYLYHLLLSNIIISFLTKVIKKIIRFIHKVLSILFRPVRFVLKRFNRIILKIAGKCKYRMHSIISIVKKQLKKQLKKHTEKVRIKREEKKARKAPEEPAKSDLHRVPKGSFELINQPEENNDKDENDEQSKKKKKKKNRI